MDVFKLEPIASINQDPAWKEASSLRPSPIWTNAPTENDAREIAANVSLRGVNSKKGTNKKQSPWLRNTHVNCKVDPSKKVPEGKVLQDGKLIDVCPDED